MSCLAWPWPTPVRVLLAVVGLALILANLVRRRS